MWGAQPEQHEQGQVRLGGLPPPPPPRRADCVLDLISTGHSCLCRFPGCWVLPVVRPLCAGSDGPPAARRSQGRLHAGQASAPAALPRHGGGGQQLPCPSIPGALRILTMQRPTLQERCPCCLHAWSRTRCSKHMQARARSATTPHEERGPALLLRCRERRPRAPPEPCDAAVLAGRRR